MSNPPQQDGREEQKSTFRGRLRVHRDGLLATIRRASPKSKPAEGVNAPLTSENLPGASSQAIKSKDDGKIQAEPHASSDPVVGLAGKEKDAARMSSEGKGKTAFKEQLSSEGPDESLGLSESLDSSGLVGSGAEATSSLTSSGSFCPYCGTEGVPPTTTHPVSLNRHSEHLNNVDFGKDLMNSFNGNIPKSKNPYTGVRILLIHWKHDDLNVIKEIAQLEKVFEKFNFKDRSHCILPGFRKTDSEAAQKALEDRIQKLRDSASESDLLIIYYAGHGVLRRDNKSYWAAHSRCDIKGQPLTPIIPWWPEQYKLENYAKNDVLFILDCCFAASAGTREIDTGIKELLAATPRESIAHGVSSYSFTSRLIYSLERMLPNGPFTVSALYMEVFNSPLDIDFPSHNWTEQELKTWQKSPIYFPLSQSQKSITIAPLLDDVQTPDDSIERISPVNAVGADESLVILTFAVDSTLPLSSLEYSEWLLALLPPEVKRLTGAKLIGAFNHGSTLIMASIPFKIWNLLPDRSAYSFVDIVKSDNLLTSQQLAERGQVLTQVTQQTQQEADNVSDIPPIEVPGTFTADTTISPLELSLKDQGAIDKFTSDLLKASEIIINDRSRYQNVYVLLLEFESDDSGVSSDSKELEEVFRQMYHFQTERFVIPLTKSYLRLSQHLAEFSLVRSEPSNLFIIYYNGHSSIDKNGDMQLCAIPKDGPEVPWTPLQQLIETEAPDVMYLFDCAYLVPTRFNVDTKGHRRDFLAASRIHQRVHLFSPENSFTRRVSRILRDYAEQGKDITTYMIYTNLVIRDESITKSRNSGPTLETPFIVSYGVSQPIRLSVRELQTSVEKSPRIKRQGGISPERSLSDSPLSQSTERLQLQVPTKGPSLDQPYKVLFSIKLKEDVVKLDSHEWINWIQNLPVDAASLSDVKVKSVFSSD